MVLTGGIASGKTTVSDLFKALGVPIIDTDKIARQIVEPGQPALQEIVRKFGPRVLDGLGKLDRPKMRQIVFKKPEWRHELESILHPRIISVARKQVDLAPGPYCIVVVPLYADSTQWPWVDRVLVIDADESVQVERVISRDGIEKKLAMAILQAQMNRHDRLKMADDVIENLGSLEHLKAQVQRLHQRYLGCQRPGEH